MNNSIKFISYKKLLIFGVEGSGKSSLTSSFKNEAFTNETHSENSK